MNLTIETKEVGLTPDQIATILRNPLPFLLVAGRSLANALKAHFLNKQNTQPNKLGGKRTNFWADVARSVNSPQARGSDTVNVAVAHPAINQKIFGGTILPKPPRKNIAIPINPIAYGEQPSTSTFKDKLELVFRRKKGGALTMFLALKEGAQKRFTYGGTQKQQIKKNISAPAGTFLYVLKKRVTQDADPTALPPESDLRRTVVTAFEDALRRRFQNTQPA